MKTSLERDYNFFEEGDIIKTCIDRGKNVPAKYLGNCEICTNDKKNKKCGRYTLIILCTFEVLPRKLEVIAKK